MGSCKEIQKKVLCHLRMSKGLGARVTQSHQVHNLALNNVGACINVIKEVNPADTHKGTG